MLIFLKVSKMGTMNGHECQVVELTACGARHSLKRERDELWNNDSYLFALHLKLNDYIVFYVLSKYR